MHPNPADLDLERERRALDLLEEALTWPRDERAARLERLVANDPQLITNVRELLAASDVVPQSLPTEMPLTTPAPDDPPPPERLGPYRRLRAARLRRNGARVPCGARGWAVPANTRHQAHAPDSLAGAGRGTVLARAADPGAARSIRISRSSSMRASRRKACRYFAMELVEGRAIHQHAADENLALRPLVELYLQVCSAVLYAHSHMVVHADIKPNNVLVTPRGRGEAARFRRGSRDRKCG